MAAPAKKPGIVIALGLDRKKSPRDDMPRGMPEPDEAEMGGPDEDFSAIAGEAFDAAKAGDKEAFVNALHEAIMCCKE